MPGNCSWAGCALTGPTLSAATDATAVPPRGAAGRRAAGPPCPGLPRSGRDLTHWAAMAISAFDLFSVGIGPSSSHTVGPMRAAHTFVRGLRTDGLLEQVGRVRAELFGSLGATGHGHGSVKAVVLGLEGEAPETTDPRAADPRLAEVRATGRLRLDGTHEIACDVDTDVVLHRRKTLPFHSNGMRFTAWSSAEPGAGEEPLHQRDYYSVGGGFVLDQDEVGENVIVPDHTPVTYPFTTRRPAARPLRGDRPADQRRDDGQRAVVAHRGRGARGPAAPVARHAGVHRERLPVRGSAARRAQGAPARAPPGHPAARRAPRRPARRHGLGDPLRAGGQRGERLGRADRHGPHERRGRHHPRGAALLHPLRPRRG